MTDGDLAPGVVVGSYRVVEQLGEGGMGTVWKAVHTGLRKSVVIKMMRRELASDRDARNRFVREGEAAARVRHPHVVEIHDVGVRDDVPYLVMEHLEGEDLAARIVRERLVPLGELAELMLPVCAGVSAAHEEGVVHRDLKPENIFLARTRDGALHPKVLDFGISRVVDDTSGRVRTQTATILGTPAYMSPEQARGERTVDDVALATEARALALGNRRGRGGGAPDSRVVGARGAAVIPVRDPALAHVPRGPRRSKGAWRATRPPRPPRRRP